VDDIAIERAGLSFQFGFHRSICRSNILRAEIETLLVSLKLCWLANFRKIILLF